MLIKFRIGLYAFSLVALTAWISKYFVHIGLVPFYDLLDVPEATPNKHYFAYIWNVLYALLFFCFYVALNKFQTLEQFYDLNTLFVTSLFIQILWTFCFFYLQMTAAAAVVIVLLDLVAVMLVHTLWGISKVSAWLFVPYVIWLLFATYLNISIVFLN